MIFPFIVGVSLALPTVLIVQLRGKLMATLEEVTAVVDSVRTTVGAIDLKLDDVRALVASLKAGQVSQEQIDALAAKVADLKIATESIASETDSIE